MRKSPLIRTALWAALFMAFQLSACRGAPGIVDKSIAGAPTGVSLSPLPTTTLTSIPAETPAPVSTQIPSLWIAPYLPESLVNTLQPPSGWLITNQPEGASLRMEVGDGNPVSRWIYALVAPFPTIEEEISLKDLKDCWKGEKAGPFSGHPILMDKSTYEVFSAWWGAPDSAAVEEVPPGQLMNFAWEHRPSWAIIPFEAIAPEWKVLDVDGQSPIQKDFDPLAYPLTVPFSLDGEPALENSVQSLLAKLPTSNRDPNKLATVIMTGVTALVRGTSNMMYLKGSTYPDQDIGAILRSADITHISNEVPFAPDCPLYNNNQTNLVFCTAPEYIKLLEDVGTKVVELTGDHFIDRGPDAVLYTLDMYRQRGWQYYGGGANLEDGQRPAKFEINGNRIAFVGCNAKGGGYATASATNPGAAGCDYDKLHQIIRNLRQQGYLPIATFQHQEYYSYQVKPQYRPDFTGMVDAGAVIVQGSEAHQPHNMEFYKGAFIHYGLGNLFFDQYQIIPGTEDAFMDWHVFYDNRYISTELIPIRFVDLARARPLTPEEKPDFLKLIFNASGW